MDASAMVDYITSTFEDVEVLVADGNSFFYYAPEHVIPERTFGFATVVTNDLYDQFSGLDRESVYRLNIGVGGARFRGLDLPTDNDFTALDRLMPHPIYGNVHWVCVLNPDVATLETAKKLLGEAYGAAVEQHRRRAARS
jgi:hypothetical protein